MYINNEPGFKALENNIIDVIKEEQIKLGYKSETIRLYYPMESLNNLLGSELKSLIFIIVLKFFALFKIILDLELTPYARLNTGR